MSFVRHLASLALTATLAAWAHGQAGATGAAENPAPTPVVLTVTVADDKGRYVADLGRESFVVYEDKAAREVLAASAEVVPVSLGIVFDVSESVMYNGAPLADETRKSFLELVKRAGGRNEYFVMGFGREARVLADWTRDPARVADGLNALPSVQQRKGSRGTALYDALYEALEKASRGAHARRALLVVSDGGDTGSRRGFAEVRRLAAESGVLVYTLIFDQRSGSGDEADAHGRLADIAYLTGGWSSRAEVYSYMSFEGRVTAARQVKKFLETLGVELRSQYAVSFRPSETAASKDGWRSVEVKVKLPKAPNKLLPARARGVYFTRPKTP